MSVNMSVQGVFLFCGLLAWVNPLLRHLTFTVSTGRSWFLLHCCSRDLWPVPQSLLMMEENTVRWGTSTEWRSAFGMKSGSKKHLCWAALNLLCCGSALVRRRRDLWLFSGWKIVDSFLPLWEEYLSRKCNLIADQSGKYESWLQNIASVVILLKMLGTDISKPRKRCCDLAQWSCWTRAMSGLWSSWGLLLSVEGAWDELQRLKLRLVERLQQHRMGS